MTSLTDDALSHALAGRYDLVREIGRGGMASVYLAADCKHDRRVAIKVMRPELATPFGTDRFLREVRLVARLQHPHILPLYDSGEAGGHLYFVMPYVEGESLRDRLSARTALPLEETARLVRQVADALDYAHGRGVVHRDLKPENVLVMHGQALLADFGIAHAAAGAASDALTEIGVTLGTPRYMSPEQAAADPAIDGRTDVYSLGCVTFEMLAGVPPFLGPTSGAYIRQHLTAEPPPLVGHSAPLPSTLPAAVARALAKDPADRFATAGALAEALERAVAEQRQPSADDQRLRQIERERAGRRSVLVLQFTNVTGAADADWLATGIAETVANDLRKVGSVRLVGQDPAVRRRIEGMRGGRLLDERVAIEIGRATDADWVVWGSYQMLGPRVRITPSFADVRGGTVHAGEKIDGTMDEVFELQDRVVTSLAELLGIRLTTREVERIRRPETESLSAYEHYARGHQAFMRFGKDSVRAAAEHFRAAIAIDPAYAPAFIGLGMLHGPMFIASGRAELLDAGTQYLRKGLELDPTLADGFAWLGYMYARKQMFGEAEAAARQGIETDPSSWFCWYMLGALSISHGLEAHQPELLARGVPPLLRTLTISPKNHAALVVLANAYQLRGEYGYATRVADEGIQLERSGTGQQFIGSLPQRAAIAIGLGDFEVARPLLTEAVARYEGADHVYAEAMTAYARWLRGCLAEREGNLELARNEFNRTCEIAEASPHRLSIGAHWAKARCGLARVRRREGAHEEADRVLSDAMAVFEGRTRFVWRSFMGGSDADVLYEHAATLADSGRADDALAQLRHAADAGWADLPWLHHDPAFAAVREQPTLRELCAEAAARVTLPPPVGSGGLE
jgi:serine/threonine-protein kinase